MLFQDRHEKPGYFLIAFLQYIFMVKPFSFFKVEFCPSFAATMQVKKLHQFIQGHQFLVISRIPSQQGKEIDNSFGQVTRLTITGRHLTGLGVVPFQRENREAKTVTITLAQFTVTIRFQQQGKMCELGHGIRPAESPVQQDMQRSGRQPFLTTDYMGNFHQMVVHNVCQMISRQFIRRFI